MEKDDDAGVLRIDQDELLFTVNLAPLYHTIYLLFTLPNRNRPSQSGTNNAGFIKQVRRQSTGSTEQKNGLASDLPKKRSRAMDKHFCASFKTLFQLALVNRRVLVEYESCFRRIVHTTGERGAGPATSITTNRVKEPASKS
ncbi:hypothetical protein K0M31_004494 [Melipona bicolor]|uniref:Uncharacterized protein n=1 Tax=Melipona bicolor TaxID=60889 RepID=A0AA40KND0_9HYME|nr:hypothetical protein K0M31_004494 [Melipona bicolor]